MKKMKCEIYWFVFCWEECVWNLVYWFLILMCLKLEKLNYNIDKNKKNLDFFYVILFNF